MCGIKYITIKEAAEKLKMKSIDSAARWCLDKNIEIMILGNKRVVSEYAFILAYEQPLIDNLKRMYGNKWAVYYEAYNSEDVTKFYELEGNTNTSKEASIAFNHNEFLNDIGYGKSKNT